MAKDISLIRIKADTNDYERSIKQAQKTWDSFTKGLGMNLGKFTAVGAAIGAVTGALKIAKDAFFKNEQQLDEWGRTVKSAESLYSGFLNALNNGNISGYLSNINNIVRAAREAYDALDELGTYNAFNQVNQEKARTNFTEAIADYREGVGSKESVQAAANKLKDELRSRQEKEYKSYIEAIQSTAAQRGIGGAVLQRILEGDYAQLEQYKNLPLTGVGYKSQSNGMFGGTTMVQTAVAATEQEKIGEVLRQLNDAEIQSLQALGAQAQRTLTEIANIDKQASRILRGGNGTTGGSGGSGTGRATAEQYIPVVGSIDAQVQKVKELQDAFNKAADQGVRNGLLKELKEAEGVLTLMRTEAPAEMFRGGSSYELSSFTDVSGLKIENDDLEKLQMLANAGNEAKDSWSSAMGAISGVGSALAGIEDPAVKVLGIVAEAIATIALTFAKSLKGTFTPWDWIAGAAAGTATMISTIAAIKSATSGNYANGGIVPGNSNSGDNLRVYGLNSGELILNTAQQNSLANTLQQGNALQNLRLTATIKGTDIQLALNNTARQQGRGTYVTSR